MPVGMDPELFREILAEAIRTRTFDGVYQSSSLPIFPGSGLPPPSRDEVRPLMSEDNVRSMVSDLYRRYHEARIGPSVMRSQITAALEVITRTFPHMQDEIRSLRALMVQGYEQMLRERPRPLRPSRVHQPYDFQDVEPEDL